MPITLLPILIILTEGASFQPGSSLFISGNLLNGFKILQVLLPDLFLKVSFLYTLLYIVLFISLIFLVTLVWDYMLKRAVDKKLEEIKSSDAILRADYLKYIEAINDDLPDEEGYVPLPKKTMLSNKSDGSIYAPEHNFYRQFAQMVPDIVFECDLKGRLIYINASAERMLGITQKEIGSAKTELFSFLHPADIERARNNFKLVTQNSRTDDAEYRIQLSDGQLLSVLAYLMPVLENNKVVSIRGLVVDISQRRKKEQTIRTLNDIVNHIDLGIYVFKKGESKSEDDFTLEMINPASSHYFKFSTSLAIGRKLNDISPLFTRNQLHQQMHKALETGDFLEISNFVYQADSSGKNSYYKLKFLPLPESRVVLLIEDVTRNRMADMETRMTTLGIENAGDLILWVDENGRFLFVNETACRKYGFSKQELLGMSIMDVDTRISSMQWYELVQILSSKPTLTIESINKTSSGETFPVEVAINRFEFDNKSFFLAFVRDISDRKHNDELEQKIQVARKSAALKQQFLANMSHEIRTPMTGIMGMTSLLMRTNLSPAQMEYVRNIKISSENLLNIINDVLDLSKIEAGKMELKPNRVNFRNFLGEIREIFHHQAQSKGLRFSTSIEPLIPNFLTIDDQRLKQILNNLLSNAFKFTDDGEISVRFGVEKQMEDEMIIQCHVKDTGMGISEENQKQIFEKFTQIDSSLIRPFEGTGLGLAICRELAELMGGEIMVKSEIGKGSTFSFTFKAKYDHQSDKSTDANQLKDFKDLKLNVLHVEDKLLNQKVVGFILFNGGCNVDFVKNGKEALDLYKPGKYDIILMDIQMPVMDGITAYQELKKLYGDMLCPVIGLSANALEGDPQKYMASGLDDYIVKPFHPNVLYEKLLKWAGKLNAQK